jgi:hypothetical protein
MTTSTARRSVRLALCSALVVGGAAAGLVAASGLETGAAAAPAPPPAEQALAAQLQAENPDAANRFLLQEDLRERAELAGLLSQIQQLRHDTAMSVVNSIR